jgi:hypothetical protein
MPVEAQIQSAVSDLSGDIFEPRMYNADMPNAELGKLFLSGQYEILASAVRCHGGELLGQQQQNEPT